MKKILEITKYYIAELDVEEFLNDFTEEWEDYKKDGYTLNEFISEMMGEYGPPDEMYGYSNEKFDTWEVRIYDN